MGFLWAGWKMLAALEWDGGAAATYWHNLCYKGWSHLWVDENDKKAINQFHKAFTYDDNNSEGGYIYNFAPPTDDWLTNNEIAPCLNLFMTDIMKMEPEEFMEICGILPGEIGAIIGGPPCQGFSTAGKRKFDDSRNQLVFRFLYYASKIKPRSFIIENVPGMLSLGRKKDEKEGPFPRWIREKANEFGYHLEYDTHNAADFGVPQNRKRVLFVGIREDLYKGQKFKMEPTHNYSYFGTDDEPQQSLFDEKKEPYVTVFEAIGDLASIRMSTYNKRAKKSLPPGHQGRIVDGEYFPWGDRNYYRDELNGLYLYSYPKISEYEHNYATEKGLVKCIHCGKYNIPVRKECWYCHNPKTLHTLETIENDSIEVLK